MMSIYSQCGEAARELLADPSLHAPEHRGFFTDLDIVELASRGHYADAEIRQALVDAKNVLNKLYKAGKVARYGPVSLNGLKPDYARIGAQIVHANPDGPAYFETPNGRFKRLMVSDADDPRTPGRRYGINRDDRIPWDQQDLSDTKVLAQIAYLRRSLRNRVAS